MLLVFGDRAFQTLLGFGFGCSLLALFMRVGGGIYTKAADVGADLVGKIEANIPEDDPRNAATIADNVGDNVGDCAGMAADVFESYSVTLVAAMILGFAAFGTKAMLFPLLVMAVGLLCSMVSTSLIGRGVVDAQANALTAMQSINRTFRIGALLSVVGIVLIGVGFLHFDQRYIITQALERNLAQPDNIRRVLVREAEQIGQKLTKEQLADGHLLALWWNGLTEEHQTRIAAGIVGPSETLADAARKAVPLREGIDLRPAYTALIGILLALALMFCTEYWTSTHYSPVQQVAKSCHTGHATNIISGIALGYESAVWAVLIIAAALLGAMAIYSDVTHPLVIAYGVSLCGIGMLTLTGDTLSMDVFGPVADNANGIGEMGYNRDANNQPLPSDHPEYVGQAEYQRARKTLADLDATGNTTKAVTKGIAIGSAVIAAVSLFASFIAVLITGTEEGISHLTAAAFVQEAGRLTVADPNVFIGMLLGGAVPFLFSSMTIRAVGRAAYLIVQECRMQFKDQAIWAGTKKPDYGRVVDICTSTAQAELIGPGLLAIFSPVFVGFFLGPYALGGFLAGMILTGQLMAVFMANAGGAWDNAKKLIEDQPKTDKTGKGSETHKASVTGDTVGDPLKDTAGPAINPLLKVMNMVGLLILPMVISTNRSSSAADESNLRWVLIAVSVVAIGWAWWQSKRESRQMQELEKEFAAVE